MGDEDRINGLDDRIRMFDGRLDDIVKSLNTISGNFGRMEAQLEGMNKLIEQRLHNHETETQASIEFLSKRVEKVEGICENHAKEINNLKDAPNIAGKEKWEKVVGIGWNLSKVLILGGGMYIATQLLKVALEK
jgi:chromosome segregation ATPase